MFYDFVFLFGALAVIAGFFLAFVSQQYWFARAWRFAGRIQQPVLRSGMRLSLLSLLVMIAWIALTAMVRNWRGTISQGSWWAPFLGLWLSSSILSYLFIKIIDGADWSSRRLRSAFWPASHTTDSSSTGPETVNQSRRYFFQAAGVFAGAVPFVSAAYGFVGERLRFEIREVDVPVANLPPALDGLRISQLSDIHIGSYMPVAQVRRAVGMANELHADLTVVTGDFLTGRTDPLEDCVTELSRLRAPLGVWGCNGNHEIYAHAEAEAAALFNRFGMKLLRYENAELKWQGSSLNLIGVDYQRQRGRDGSRSLMLAGLEPLVRRDIPNILLSHNPNSFPRAAELGIELSLAGHTHGGQVRVEILDHRWSPAQFFTPYVAGLYRQPLLRSSLLSEADAAVLPHASSFVYVNRGLGTIGAPVRLGVPPEITLLTLRRV
jgi:predicted MPP superfamily phosphohydrolase